MAIRALVIVLHSVEWLILSYCCSRDLAEAFSYRNGLTKRVLVLTTCKYKRQTYLFEWTKLF